MYWENDIVFYTPASSGTGAGEKDRDKKKTWTPVTIKALVGMVGGG